MERITLAQFRDEQYDESHDIGVYVIFNDVACLYVGMSNSNVWNRWFQGTFRSHLAQDYGGRWKGNSTVARNIERSLPQSWDWPVELWRIEDCLARFALDIERMGFKPSRMDVRACELLLKHHYQPLLNAQA